MDNEEIMEKIKKMALDETNKFMRTNNIILDPSNETSYLSERENENNLFGRIKEHFMNMMEVIQSYFTYDETKNDFKKYYNNELLN
jgi:hypothetical protein